MLLLIELAHPGTGQALRYIDSARALLLLLACCFPVVRDHQAQAFADKNQPEVRAEIVEQLFNNKVGHVWIHLLGEQHMRSKPLISIEKSTYSNYEVTDSG